LVVDAGQSDLYVQCMYHLGKKGHNCLYWPKKLKDVRWYDYDDVLAVIPEPTKIESSYSHFQISSSILKSIQDYSESWSVSRQHDFISNVIFHQNPA
jgi:hypothetical protein